jgi:4-hydroxybenzoate polyprenyltransferase
MHFAAVCMMLWLAHVFGLGALAHAGFLVVALLLVYEHSIIAPHDLRRMNAAFFTLNGIISVVFFAAVCGDVFLRR